MHSYLFNFLKFIAYFMALLPPPPPKHKKEEEDEEQLTSPKMHYVTQSMDLDTWRRVCFFQW